MHVRGVIDINALTVAKWQRIEFDYNHVRLPGCAAAINAYESNVCMRANQLVNDMKQHLALKALEHISHDQLPPWLKDMKADGLFFVFFLMFNQPDMQLFFCCK